MDDIAWFMVHEICHGAFGVRQITIGSSMKEELMGGLDRAKGRAYESRSSCDEYFIHL
jgi:hypothetical protein